MEFSAECVSKGKRRRWAQEGSAGVVDIDLTNRHPRHRVLRQKRLADADGAPSLACSGLAVDGLEHQIRAGNKESIWKLQSEYFLRVITRSRRSRSCGNGVCRKNPSFS